MPRVLDSVRKRFSETAEAVAALQDQRAEEERRRVAQVLPLKGTERVLDVGTGAGALALAVAPIAGEVVGIDVVPELLAEARKRAPGNLELYLDLAGCTGEERERARSLAPSPVTGQYGWYLLAKPSV